MEIDLQIGYVRLTIFVLMVNVGLAHSPAQLAHVWRRPARAIRSLVPILLLVPATAIALIVLLDLPRPAATGLAVLASAPGSVFTTRRAHIARVETAHAASLQLSLALLAIVVTPLTLGALNALLTLECERVSTLVVAQQVFVAQLLPVSLGLLGHHLRPALAMSVTRPLMIVANLMYVAMIALVLLPGLRITHSLVGVPLLAIFLLAGIALLAGHLIGGPTAEERTTVALATTARNGGLALLVVALNDASTLAAQTVVGYLVLGALMALAYAIARRRRESGRA